jgi:acyl-CoA reductase-like NAD-dependent aldehyde dehydrogenase
MGEDMTNQHAYLWIDGEWTGEGPASPSCGDCIDPSSGGRVATFAPAERRHVEAALAAARRVFDRTDWSHAPRRRAQVLLDFADRLAARKDEIAKLLTLVNGKLLRESAGEIGAAVSELRYYAGIARNLFGRIVETEPGCYSHLAREALGVCAVIVPWNAPVTLLARSLAPALAAGCTVVIKAAPQTSAVTAQVLSCLESAGVPRGVVNLFSEAGSDGAQLLVQSPAVDGISFTGSNAVGKKIMAAASGTMKRLSLELGGKSPSIVFADADLPGAAATLTAASTVMAGQMCTAAARVLVHESVAAEMRERLKAALGSVRVGPGLDPASGMGPLIDVRSRDRVAGIIERAGDEGRMLLKGGPLAGMPRGAFLTPTLVEVANTGSALIQEEIFGPVLVFETFTSEDEAIERANATRYGLAASVWTADRQRAQRVAARLATGTVWINSYNKLMAEAETGGYRESGLGRLHGLEAMNDFMQTKHIYYEDRA